QPRDPPPRRAQAEVGPIHAIEVKEVGVSTEEHGRTDPVAHARPKARRHALERIDSRPSAALRRRARNRAGPRARGAVRAITPTNRGDASDWGRSARRNTRRPSTASVSNTPYV